MMKNMETEVQLTKRARNLTKQLNNENLKLEKTQQQQKDQEVDLKSLEDLLEIVRRETANADQSNQTLSNELGKLDNQKIEQLNEFA
jgi:hypothetical protein